MVSKSKKLFDQAKKIIPSGVNSPVRYFKPYPFFVKKSQGSSIWDEDGKRYVDYCNGYGALLLGHTRKEIISAVSSQLKKGTLYTIPTALEVELSKLIIKNFPSMDKVRLVNTGAEATMTAISSVLVQAGSGSAHIGLSVSEGGLSEVSKNTLVVPYNDSQTLEQVLSKHKDVAGLIIEPILANMGLILPEKNFLSDVRKITKQHDVPLIFDEVVTGFRVSEGGAQKTFKIKPDITTLGKALGNGFTIAAVGGKKDIMNKLAPEGNVYQASTFAGNPISVTAAINSIKTINKMKNKLYSKLERNCELLVDEIDDLATDNKIPHQINSIASMFQIFFSSKPVTDYKSSKKSNAKKFHKLFSNLLKNGVFIAPSQFETVFLSDAHTDVDIMKTLGAYGLSLKAVKN